MFSWSDFRKVALPVVEHQCQDDAELSAILTSDDLPPKIIDEIGRPSPNSATVNQHPDTANYTRVIGIRRSIALKEGNSAYVAYADNIMTFLNSIGEFSESNPFHIILVATHKDQYEFLYASQVKQATAFAVGHLGGSKQAN